MGARNPPAHQAEDERYPGRQAEGGRGRSRRKVERDVGPRERAFGGDAIPPAQGIALRPAENPLGEDVSPRSTVGLECAPAASPPVQPDFMGCARTPAGSRTLPVGEILLGEGPGLGHGARLPRAALQTRTSRAHGSQYRRTPHLVKPNLPAAYFLSDFCP